MYNRIPTMRCHVIHSKRLRRRRILGILRNHPYSMARSNTTLHHIWMHIWSRHHTQVTIQNNTENMATLLTTATFLTLIITNGVNISIAYPGLFWDQCYMLRDNFNTDHPEVNSFGDQLVWAYCEVTNDQ